MRQITFGEKLKGLRKKSGKSQVEVAQEISQLSGEARISQATLSSLEQRATAPREDILNIFALYFDVPVTYFFDSDSYDQERVERAKTYLDSLKRADFERQRNYAHSSGRREPDDDLTQMLNRLGYDEDDDKYLDT